MHLNPSASILAGTTISYTLVRPDYFRDHLVLEPVYTLRKPKPGLIFVGMLQTFTYLVISEQEGKKSYITIEDFM